MEEEKIKKGISLKRIWKMVWPSVRTFWYIYPIIVVLTVALTAMTVIEPLIYGRVVDSLVNTVGAHTPIDLAFQSLIPLLFWWAMLVLGETFCSSIWNYSRWKINNELSSRFATALYRRMIELDVRRFQEEKGGEVMRRYNNAWDALHLVSNTFWQGYFSATLRLFGALGVGLWIDWRLALIALIPVPINVTIGLFNIKVTSKDQRKANDIWDETSGHAGDAFDNITAIKAFRGESRSVSLTEAIIQKAISFQNRVNIKWALGEGISGPTYVLGRLAIFFAGGYFVLNGTTTIGTLIVFLGFVSFIYGAVQQIMMALPETTRALHRLNRAADYWEEIPEIRNRPNAKIVKRLKGDITFDRVSYGYRNGRVVLHGIDLHIPQGQTFAMVGESGAGKSTFAQMLMRFHDPKSGSIKIDGLDIRDLDLGSLRSNIGFVMQENMLFHDSIINNIKFARPGAAEKEIVEAAKRAQAHEFIKGLKNGYKTVVGERGVKLSGGEKQRIALARVLLANPPILVLDEATSALDSKTEHSLQAALREVMKDRTTLVIAHRLSTVMQADQIIVMHKGKIVDQGKHEELIKRGGLYKQYWEIQAGGYV
ncbi:MAG: ABC transporter ATP-binding protein [Candidatus Uhrbacteria bacterium]